jgi:ABC-2 type transport system permease protein
MTAELIADSIRARRRSIAWWAFGIVAMVAVVVLLYPSVRDSGAGLDEYARELPEALRGLFTGGEIDMTSPIGYLNSQMFALMAPLLLIIFAIGFGSAAVAGEEEQGQLDLLLAHPVPRDRVVLARFAAMLALCACLSVVLCLSTAAGSLLVGLEIGLLPLLAVSLSVGLLAACFGSVAIVVGALRPGRGGAVAVSASVAIAAWLLDGLGQAVDALDAWRPISPFYRLIAANPLRDGMPWGGFAVVGATTLALAGLAVLALRRRDVQLGN